MKPTIKDIVASQSWIEEVKKSKAAMNAFRAWQTLMVPSLIKARIKKTASDANVPYEDVALMNLAYEASMVALAGLPPIRDLFLAAVSSGLPATSWGCSSFGVVEVIGDREMGGQHGRNLDWPDPGKILRDSTTVVKEGKMPYWTVGFPGQAGVLTGSADYRFSVSLNAVYTDKVGWGQAPVYLVRKALEECKDFNEALKLICKTRLMVGALFLLMEGRENCVIPEWLSLRGRRISIISADRLLMATKSPQSSAQTTISASHQKMLVWFRTGENYKKQAVEGIVR